MAEVLRNMRTMCSVSWQADRARSVGALLSTAFLPVSRSLQAVGLGLLADGVVTGNERRAVTGALLVAVLVAANGLLDWASVTVRMRLREHTILLLDQQVMGYVAGTPGLEHHELPEHQDQLGLIRWERWALNNPFMPIAWTLGSGVQMLATLAVLGSLHPLLLLLPLAALPSMIAGLRIERLKERVRKEHAEAKRSMALLFELATTAPAGKEIRVFDLAAELERRYRETFTPLDRRERAADFRAGVMAAGGWACFALGYMAAVAFVVVRAVAGDLSVTAVVVTLSLGAQVNGQVAELVENSRWFLMTTQAVGRYRWLAEYAARAHAALKPAVPALVPARLSSGITFAGVSFTYPGTDVAVFKDVDLELPAGSTVAIVGENGAGKTTLAKLLMRFYEPTQGSILVDGVDIRRFEVEAWRERLSAGFQDFAKLEFLARESVGVGHLPRLDDVPAVVGALERAAAGDLVAKLPAGLDTQLGREFDGGVDISTGQWQKLALARAMMREDPLLLLLDEPTASLDAATEHALFERFAGQARWAAGRTGAVTLLVSHRFSTVRMADLILVVEDGRVIERGDHCQLMAADGRYAELYSLQATSYR
ncbi:MAG TPA: ABC transporter ATP-binding protein [Acidimicrobiales bacterium]|nr:ABC transporter ATP-binding protein [Acidimicrobiales bacterium]